MPWVTTLFQEFTFVGVASVLEAFDDAGLFAGEILLDTGCLLGEGFFWTRDVGSRFDHDSMLGPPGAPVILSEGSLTSTSPSVNMIVFLLCNLLCMHEIETKHILTCIFTQNVKYTNLTNFGPLKFQDHSQVSHWQWPWSNSSHINTNTQM